ncbi:MAG: NUDIX hydrolase [Candidatus Doudnabacteria bacterium]|nr:NUDIX hydrolase [Candidatus Doudnabacteria bacterium]
MQAAVRELKEETSLDLEQQMIPAGKYYVRYPEFDYIFHVFKLKFTEMPMVETNVEEHSGYKWFKPNEALDTANLIPGLSEIIRANYL